MTADTDISTGTTDGPVPALEPKVLAWLWKLLVTGLMFITVLALCALIYTVLDGDTGTSPDALVGIFSASLAGMVGLFVRSPDSR